MTSSAHNLQYMYDIISIFNSNRTRSPMLGAYTCPCQKTRTYSIQTQIAASPDYAFRTPSPEYFSDVWLHSNDKSRKHNGRYTQ